MNTDYPVVIYGASGYTGRLVAEHLLEFAVPFIALGRNEERIKDNMKLVPGIENATYKIVECSENSADALSKAFVGARVVCNTVGPFMRYNLAVAEACVRVGAHYLDTTGEQSAMMQLDDNFGADFVKNGLVMIPSTAYMYGLGNLGAEICLETPGINSLRMHAIGNAVPTVASAQTILDAVRHPTFYLQDNQMVRYPGIENGQLATPSGEVLTTSNWGGSSNVVWFAKDGRVRNCKADVAIWNQELWKKEKEIERAYKVSLQWLPEDQLAGVLDNMAKDITPGTPPREERHVHRSIDICHGTGNNVSVKTTMYSTGGYLTTGLLQAYCAARLARGEQPRVTGMQSPAKVFGHRELLGILQSWGYCGIKVEKMASPQPLEQNY